MSEFISMLNEKFWTWFSENNEKLKPSEITDTLKNELDSWVKKLNVPSWEIGPYNEQLKLSFFALSPSGNPEIFEKTKSITTTAPPLEGWIFLAAKPPKSWNRKLLWSEQETLVDANDWSFLVYRYDDGLSDVVLVDDVLTELPLTERKKILDFVVGSEIGELGMLNSVYATDIDTSIHEDLRHSAIKLRDLKGALKGEEGVESV